MKGDKGIGREALVTYLAREFQCDRSEAKDMLEAFGQSIANVLVSGFPVALPHVGTIDFSKREGRRGRIHGEAFESKDTFAPILRASKRLKATVNATLQSRQQMVERDSDTTESKL